MLVHRAHSGSLRPDQTRLGDTLTLCPNYASSEMGASELELSSCTQAKPGGGVVAISCALLVWCGQASPALASAALASASARHTAARPVPYLWCACLSLPSGLLSTDYTMANTVLYEKRYCRRLLNYLRFRSVENSALIWPTRILEDVAGQCRGMRTPNSVSGLSAASRCNARCGR